MITKIKINNFKSVADLTLQLGRVNVLIGSNGSGKSNILEAIAFGGAASADKLDNEFLGSRGIRTASVKLMKSAFSSDNLYKNIVIDFFMEGNDIKKFTINENNKPILKWVIQEKEKIEEFARNTILLLFNDDFKNTDYYKKLPSNEKKEFSGLSKNFKNILNDKGLKLEKDNDPIQSFRSIFNGQIVEDYLFKKKFHNDIIAQFLIYSPEISSLRKFEEESQIKPLGIKGEGLFNVLQVFYENYGSQTIDELRKHLHIIEWFDDFEAVFDMVSGRSSLVVKDRNLPDVTLNQHNVNEGFLFLLFYMSLMISNETPAFFAIDNIEASFHPILCEELIKVLVELAKKHNKQVILTTHNPFVLDGLDLNDPEQKLFVVERNGDGETIANEVKPVKKGKLSEAWLRGRIGGNPETI